MVPARLLVVLVLKEGISVESEPVALFVKEVGVSVGDNLGYAKLVT